jgi:hypothetical protein
VLGQQRLVRGDHRLAAGNRRQCQLARSRGAADQFDNDVDLGLAYQLLRIRPQTDAVQAAVAHARRRARRRVGDDQRPADTARDLVGVVLQQAQHALPDRAKADDADSYGYAHR